MKFKDLIQLLQDTNTSPAVLVGKHPGRRVVCAPALVGRVMSCTFDSAAGDALGWIEQDAISGKRSDPVFNNFGGEERIWFGPEGSQFGLHFASRELKLSDYRVQAAMSSQPYELVPSRIEGTQAVMQARVELSNLAGTTFHLQVRRVVSIVESCPFSLGAGEKVECVGFQSETTVTNVSSDAIRPETGLLSCWTPGLHPGSRGCVIVIPFSKGSNEELGPPIREDYIPYICPHSKLVAGSWCLADEYAAFKSDGNCRAKVSVARKRAVNRLGSYNVETHELIINQFDLYAELPYVGAYWRTLSASELLDGEAVSCYIDGPDENGAGGSNFYELETLSPALALAPGEEFTHRNRVFHLRGDARWIDAIAQRALRANLEAVAAGLKLTKS